MQDAKKAKLGQDVASQYTMSGLGLLSAASGQLAVPPATVTTIPNRKLKREPSELTEKSSDEDEAPRVCSVSRCCILRAAVGRKLCRARLGFYFMSGS